MPQQMPADVLNTFSRTLAAGLLMLGFAVGGHYLDQWLGTNFLVLVGLIVGMTCSTAVMLIHAKLSEYENSIKNVKPLAEDDEVDEARDDADHTNPRGPKR